jgi:hypothetical protein
MDWKETLSDEYKDSAVAKKFGSSDELVKSYQHLESRLGGSIRIPSAEATPEDKAEVYQKVMKSMPELMLKPNLENAEQSAEYYQMLGVPKNIDDYDAGDTKLDADMVNQLRQLGAKTNMTQAQFKAYIRSMDDMNGITQQQTEDARIRMGAELKTEWGMAFEDRYAVVEKHLQENPDLGPIENMNPSQLRGHYAVARSLNGTAQMHSQPTPASNMLAPDEARAQIHEIRNNPAFLDATVDRNEHKRLVAKNIELMKSANPGRYS